MTTPLNNGGIRSDEALIAEIVDGKIVLSREFAHRSLRDRAAEYGGRLNLSDEIQWDEPAGSEVW